MNKIQIVFFFLNFTMYPKMCILNKGNYKRSMDLNAQLSKCPKCNKQFIK